MQLHGIALSFHRQMQDASRKLFWPNIVMAVSPESYPPRLKAFCRVAPSVFLSV
jgi:hypothetical protein